MSTPASPTDPASPHVDRSSISSSYPRGSSGIEKGAGAPPCEARPAPRVPIPTVCGRVDAADARARARGDADRASRGGVGRRSRADAACRRAPRMGPIAAGTNGAAATSECAARARAGVCTAVAVALAARGGLVGAAAWRAGVCRTGVLPPLASARTGGAAAADAAMRSATLLTFRSRPVADGGRPEGTASMAVPVAADASSAPFSSVVGRAPPPASHRSGVAGLRPRALPRAGGTVTSAARVPSAVVSPAAVDGVTAGAVGGRTGIRNPWRSLSQPGATGSSPL
mmetsp:Transcript_820/g.2399  ORF Transcript_820/g.2399 Transcript_820/m.2399 type:complete len:285 (-) Transcript_820:1726-2580(-)